MTIKHNWLRAWVCEAVRNNGYMTYRELFRATNPGYHDHLLDVIVNLWLEGYVATKKMDKVIILKEPRPHPDWMAHNIRRYNILPYLEGDIYKGSKYLDECNQL